LKVLSDTIPTIGPGLLEILSDGTSRIRQGIMLIKRGIQTACSKVLGKIDKGRTVVLCLVKENMNLKEKLLQVMSGVHVAAVATVEDGKPVVRYMALNGLDDLTLIGATMTTSRKVGQIKKKPDVALAIWSCKEFTDPYVVIQAKGSVHGDIATKKKYWNTMWEEYFKTPENKDFVVVKFVPMKIEYSHGMETETWEK
jgi:general stress protein 26